MKDKIQKRVFLCKICFDEKGQITVFLALLFLVLLGFSLVIIEGVESYSASYMAEDVIKNAGENIMANYSKELFKNYHIFFLDPREKEYILSDGKKYIDQGLSGSTFFNIHCNSLDIVEEKAVVDDDGLYFKHEIREWMKYREKVKAENGLKNIIKDINGNHAEREQYDKDIKAAETEEQEITNKTEKNETQKEEGNTQGGEVNTEEEQVSPETQKERMTWKEIKEVLHTLLKTGVLFYVSDNPEKLSNKSISLDNLPSRARGGLLSAGKDEIGSRLNALSFSNIKEIRNLFDSDISIDKNSMLLTRDNYIIPYIEECFSCYCSNNGIKGGKKADKTVKKNGNKGKVLSYETEYLISGKSSDLDNLKTVANRILSLRFMTNYVLAGENIHLRMQIEAMAAAVSGFMGMPQAMKAVEVLIRTALSYGESLLEVHTLFAGGEIPLIKSEADWNLELSTMARQLKEKKQVKRGKRNISYQDFLKILLLTQGQSRKLCYRMMDIMQINIALKESGFLMENCLFSYKWKANFSIGTIGLDLERQNNY